MSTITITDQVINVEFTEETLTPVIIEAIGIGSGGEGDMNKSTYDPQNKRQDIFAYTDNTVAAAIGVAADDLYNYLTEGL